MARRKSKKKHDTTPYPWDRWLRQNRITFKRHRDFRCQLHSFGVLARHAAYVRGMVVSVFIREDTQLVTIVVKSRRVA